MEIMLAIAVTTMGILAIGYLLFDGRASYEQQQALLTARMLANEGIAVAGTLLADAFDSVAAGTYGVTTESVSVTLAPGSDTVGSYTRTVTVTDDAEGEKTVVAGVSWLGVGDAPKSVSLTTRYTDWRQRSGDAQFLNVSPTASFSASSTRIEGITLENVGSHAVTLDALAFTWEGSETPERITIDGVDVWLAASSTELIASGSPLDIVDVVLPERGVKSVDGITLSGARASGDMLMTFICSDGSERYVRLSL